MIDSENFKGTQCLMIFGQLEYIFNIIIASILRIIIFIRKHSPSSLLNFSFLFTFLFIYSEYKISIQFMKIIKLINTILILSVSARCDFFLYLSMASQIFVPGQNYSSINVTYNPETIRDPRFNIQINFYLNQTMGQDQTNNIFDLIACNNSQPGNNPCYSCFVQNYQYLNARYAKNQPCLEICPQANSIQYINNTITNFSFELTKDLSLPGYIFIIDNTFFPCRNGSYQPQLYLSELFSVSIQNNSGYRTAIQIVFLVLLQVVILLIAYLIIMYKKYKKLKKNAEFLKGQEQAQDLLNSFLNNNPGK